MITRSSFKDADHDSDSSDQNIDNNFDKSDEDIDVSDSKGVSSDGSYN